MLTTPRWDISLIFFILNNALKLIDNDRKYQNFRKDNNLKTKYEMCQFEKDKDLIKSFT